MIEYLLRLFDTSDFRPRWYVQNWSAGGGWVHVVSDIATFGASIAIPCVLLWYVRKKKGVVLPSVFWLLAAFIAACGSVHLIEAIVFWHPVYRLSGLLKCCTAILAWATVIAVIRIAPSAMQFPSLIMLNQQLEREIRERRTVEERLASVLNSMSDGVMVSDCEGNIDMLNPAARAIFQFDESDLSYSERFKRYTVNSADGQHRLVAKELPMKRAGTGESTDDLELVVRCASKGLDASIILSARPVHDANDRIIGAVAVFRDITSLKRERFARLTSEARLAAIVDSMSDGVAVVTANGKLEFLNPAAKRILGVAHVDSVSEKWSRTYGLRNPETGDLVPMEELPLIQALAGAASVEKEILVRNDNLPEDKLIAVRATPIHEDGERLIGAVAVFHDITEARRIEIERSEHIQELERTTAVAAALAQATQTAPHDDHQLLAAIANELQADSVSLATCTPDGDVDWRSFKALSASVTRRSIPVAEWNYFAFEELTTSPAVLKELETPSGVICNPIIVALSHEGRPHGAILAANHSKGLADENVDVLRRISLLAAPAIFTRQQLAESQRHKTLIESQLRESRNQIERLARVNTLGEITAGISHELNQPLTAIVNFTDEAHAIAKEELHTDSLEQLVSLTRKASEQAARAGSVLRSIRSIVGRSTAHIETFDLRDLIRETVELVSPQTGLVQIEIMAGVQPDVVLLEADRTQIQQLLVNLIQNGINAVSDQQKKEITLNASLTAQTVIISVADTGCGITESDVDRVFDAFFTTGQGGLGLGLGLKICRTIAELHGGHIELSNNDFGGATFVVTLPRTNSNRECAA